MGSSSVPAASIDVPNWLCNDGRLEGKLSSFFIMVCDAAVVEVAAISFSESLVKGAGNVTDRDRDFKRSFSFV